MKAKLISGEKYAIYEKEPRENEAGAMVNVQILQKEVIKSEVVQQIASLVSQIDALQLKKVEFTKIINAINAVV